MSFWSQQQFAVYLRGHLVGASLGIRLAELLAADPWTGGQLESLPAELAEEIEFVQQWTRSLSSLPEVWLRPTLVLTAAARAAIARIRPIDGQLRRMTALEAMRALLLAKKAMWELGLALSPVALRVDRDTVERYDKLALRQAEQVQRLHQRAAAELASTAQ